MIHVYYGKGERETFGGEWIEIKSNGEKKLR